MTPVVRHGRPSVAGRDTGPVRAQCEVLARKREGAYWTLTLAGPEIADRARPGQFVNVVVGAPGAILRRPFSIYRVSRQGPFAGTVEFVFDVHGPGTAWLAGIEAHTILDVVGPLGSPFPLPKGTVPCLLVGGGYGVAPLFFLADELAREGMRVDMLVGARTQERLFNVIEAKRITASVTFTTDDGSFGVEGTVTDALPEVARSAESRVVYACGPMPMLRAVARTAGDLKLPCQVAVEEHMACGVGVCWTCVVPVRSRNGIVRMRRSCLDGPVFNAARVAWDESRWAEHGAAVDEGTLERASSDTVWPGR